MRPLRRDPLPSVGAIFALSLLPAAALAQPESPYYAAVKPAPAELKWRRIPWELDLAEAQRAARRENRPLLIWATGDDPLERC